MLLQAIISQHNGGGNHQKLNESGERKRDAEVKEVDSSGGEEEVAEAEEEEGAEQVDDGDQRPAESATDANAAPDESCSSQAAASAADRENSASALDTADRTSAACGQNDRASVAGGPEAWDERITRAVSSSVAAPAAPEAAAAAVGGGASGPTTNREPDTARGSGTPRSKSLLNSRSNSRRGASLTRGTAATGWAGAPAKGRRKVGARDDTEREARHSAQQQLHVSLGGPNVEYVDKLETWRTIELLFAAIKCESP